jgi:PAS domain S-box-containing protein
VHGSRKIGLLTVGLAASALAVAVYALRETPDPTLVARWWPATALTTALLVSTPRRHTRLLLALVALVFLAASLVAGRDTTFSIGFAVANTIEAVVVLWFLTGLEVSRPELRSWADYFRWLMAISLGAWAAGVITAGTIGLGGDHDLWRPMLWVTVTHMGAQAVLLPMFLRRSRHQIRVPVLEVLAHLALLALGSLACVAADPSQPVAFLLLPLLMWSAARFTTRWANLELLFVALGLAALTHTHRGPFKDITGAGSVTDIAASAQSFVAIGAITCVAFSVAMNHLRDSLRKIQHNEVQLGQLLDSASGTAFIATDLEGIVTWFSPGAEQLLGYAAEDVVGRTTPMPFHESREILSRAQKLRTTPGYDVVTHPVAHGADQDTRDWTYVRKDGSRLTVSVSVTAVRDPYGAPMSFLSVVRDVTDRRAAEQALVFALDKERETNKRMLDLDRAKGEFVSAVSHELRTPLTSIVGYTELLADDVPGTLTEQQQQLVERIDRNGERLLTLVEDLLTMARVEDGNLSLERVETDLRDAVRVATDEVAHSAHKGRVSLNVNLPSEPVMMEGDPAYLERLVLNLAGNAVKFTEAGGEVEATLRVTGEVAELSVTDTGMGIPLEDQGRLFQKFFRSSVATEHAIQGTGLGLHIVRSIAEAHHGEITFESTPGQGTTFWFRVPLVRATPGGVPPDRATPSSPAQVTPTHPSRPAKAPGHRGDSAEARR